MLSIKIFTLYITQYDLGLWVDFSLIGWDPLVTLLLAGLVKQLVDGGNELCR